MNNAQDAQKSIDAYYQKLIQVAQQAMVEGMREYEAYEIKTEMSGRPGLKRQSGALAGSWHVETEGEGLNYTAKLSNSKSTFYAVTHQEGMTIRPKNGPYLHYKLPDGSFRKSKEVTIPKRLNFTENFATVGKEMVMKQLRKAVSEIHKETGTPA